MTTGVPGLGGVVQLAEVIRSGFVESRHFGIAVALGPGGQILYAAGQTDATVLPRSTAKPLQAVASGTAEAPDPVRMNCSGNHAAMLATTVASGNDVATYLDPARPVQRRIAAECARLSTAPAGTPEARVAEAMRTHPELVGGTGHPNTTVMRLLPGVLAKGGAEGVMAMSTADGHAVAVKIIDGSPRATTAPALSVRSARPSEGVGGGI
jgi:L-asparaginase II